MQAQIVRYQEIVPDEKTGEPKIVQRARVLGRNEALRLLISRNKEYKVEVVK